MQPVNDCRQMQHTSSWQRHESTMTQHNRPQSNRQKQTKPARNARRPCRNSNTQPGQPPDTAAAAPQCLAQQRHLIHQTFCPHTNCLQSERSWQSDCSDAIQMATLALTRECPYVQCPFIQNLLQCDVVVMQRMHEVFSLYQQNR